MVSYCANPLCHKPLHYLREGKIFLFSRRNSANKEAKTAERLEHFWLCGICAKEWTLTMDSKQEVQLAQMRRRQFRSPYKDAAPAA